MIRLVKSHSTMVHDKYTALGFAIVAYMWSMLMFIEELGRLPAKCSLKRIPGSEARNRPASNIYVWPPSGVILKTTK